MDLCDASIAMESWEMVAVSKMHLDGIYLTLKHALKGSIFFFFDGVPGVCFLSMPGVKLHFLF